MKKTLGFVCAAAIALMTGPAVAQTIGEPLPGLTPAELAAFEEGRLAFARGFTPPEGLGPVFNDVSCVACHNQPVPGGSGGRLVTRFGRVRGKSFDPLVDLGGSLIQDRAIARPSCDFDGEVVPPEANVESPRRTQPFCP